MLITERKGLTLIELIVCTVIIGILSTTALPLAKNVVRHQKEAVLFERLTEMRKAIDAFHARKSVQEPGLSDKEYYPVKLEDLVEARLLRKIPVDPFTGEPDWKTRSSTDDPDSQISNMLNVFDVFSASPDTDLKGRPYQNW